MADSLDYDWGGFYGSILPYVAPPSAPATRGISVPSVEPYKISFEPVDAERGAAFARNLGRPVVTPSGKVYEPTPATSSQPASTTLAKREVQSIPMRFDADGLPITATPPKSAARKTVEAWADPASRINHNYDRVPVAVERLRQARDVATTPREVFVQREPYTVGYGYQAGKTIDPSDYRLLPDEPMFAATETAAPREEAPLFATRRPLTGTAADAIGSLTGAANDSPALAYGPTDDLSMRLLGRPPVPKVAPVEPVKPVAPVPGVPRLTVPTPSASLTSAIPPIGTGGLEASFRPPPPTYRGVNAANTAIAAARGEAPMLVPPVTTPRLPWDQRNIPMPDEKGRWALSPPRSDPPAFANMSPTLMQARMAPNVHTSPGGTTVRWAPGTATIPAPTRRSSAPAPIRAPIAAAMSLSGGGGGGGGPATSSDWKRDIFG